jgi:hypothetical protein
MRKLIHVNRYLKQTAGLGPTYYTEEGVRLYGHVDASYGVHTNGRSQTGFYTSIGRHSAPVTCYAACQKSCMATSSMYSEYVALGELGKKVEEQRYFLSSIGFPQHAPTELFEDNQSAINLAQAPAISRKSRFIHVRHHYVRDLIKRNVVKLTHLPTSQMTADLLTKPKGPKQFKMDRDKLLNVPSHPRWQRTSKTEHPTE